MTILITGSAGFVGKNLTAALSNIRDGKDKTHPHITVTEILEYDINTPPELLDEYCQKADFVFHLAGVNRPKNTITKMRNYLEQYVGEPLYEISNYYEEFVRGFRQLYEKLVGTEKINRSTKREIWGHKAMMNRLKTLEAYGIYYHFELGAGFYKLVKNLYENT